MVLPVFDDNEPLPDITTFNHEIDILGAGEVFIARLTPERLLESLSIGAFPRYHTDLLEEILSNHGYPNLSEIKDKYVWSFPEYRFIIKAKELIEKYKTSKNLKKSIKKYEIRVNHDFEKSANICSSMYRGKNNSTRLTKELLDAYFILNKQGHILSIEAYKEDKLCGGVIGFGAGDYFFGDSMFRNIEEYGKDFTSNSSKAALVHLALMLGKKGIIDCQYQTKFLQYMCGETTHELEFYTEVQKRTNQPSILIKN